MPSQLPFLLPPNPTLLPLPLADRSKLCNSVDCSWKVWCAKKMWLLGLLPLIRKGPSGFNFFSTAEQVTEGVDGSALTAIVTGSTNGIGMETARVLARRGVHVVMAVRNLPLGYRVQEKILKEPGPSRVDIMELDLSSMASIRKFASEFKSLNLPLNILINNAGVSSTTFALSKDGIEMQFATNYLGHFLLANLLLDKMKETTQKSNVEGRIINVSSLCHRRPYREGIRFEKINDRSSYDRFRAYGQSKLANILHSNELTRRLKEDDAKLTANSVHPGAIPTNITSHNFLIKAFFNGIFKIIGKNIHQGAATTCYVALHPDLEGVSGKYFADCNLTKSSKLSQDEQLARKLWDYSMKWIGD